MVVTFGDSILRCVVSQLCRDIGWHASNNSTLDVLTELTRHYIHQLGSVSCRYAEHCGRTEANLDDIALAFQELNINLNDLRDYVDNVEPSPLAVQIPKFPVPNNSNRIVFGDGQEKRHEG